MKIKLEFIFCWPECVAAYILWRGIARCTVKPSISLTQPFCYSASGITSAQKYFSTQSWLCFGSETLCTANQIINETDTSEAELIVTAPDASSTGQLGCGKEICSLPHPSSLAMRLGQYCKKKIPWCHLVLNRLLYTTTLECIIKTYFTFGNNLLFSCSLMSKLKPRKERQEPKMTAKSSRSKRPRKRKLAWHLTLQSNVWKFCMLR